MVDITGLLTALSIPVIRSLGGWATKATADGVIEKFEVRKLAETIVKTSIYGVLIYFGAEGYGVELEPVAAGATAVLFDIVLSSFKEKKRIA